MGKIEKLTLEANEVFGRRSLKISTEDAIWELLAKINEIIDSLQPIEKEKNGTNN